MSMYIEYESYYEQIPSDRKVYNVQGTIMYHLPYAVSSSSDHNISLSANFISLMDFPLHNCVIGYIHRFLHYR